VRETRGSTAGVTRREGTQALFGAAIAIVGALAAVHPTSRVLAALSEEMPRLAVSLPPVITAVGALIAAFSKPPGRGGKK
jgi:hypothetical protein